MKKQKIAKSNNGYVMSSNNYEDEECSICQLLSKCESENREPTEEELEFVFDFELNR